MAELPLTDLFDRPEPPLPDLPAVSDSFRVPAKGGIVPALPDLPPPAAPVTPGLPGPPAPDHLPPRGGQEPVPLPDLPDLTPTVSAVPAPSPALDTPAGPFTPAPLRALDYQTPEAAPGSLPDLPAAPLSPLPAPAPATPLPPLTGPDDDPLRGSQLPSAGGFAGAEGLGQAVSLLAEIADSLRSLARSGTPQLPHAPANGPGYVPFPGLGSGDLLDGFAPASASADVSRLSGLRGAGGYGFGTYAGPDTRGNYLEPLARHPR